MMARLNVAILSLWLAFAPVLAQVGIGNQPNYAQLQPALSGGCGSTVALGGSGIGTNSGSAASYTVTVTTTLGSGVIVIGNEAQLGETVSSVTSSPVLTWAQRGTNLTGGNDFSQYIAPYASNTTYTITVNLTNTTFASSVAFEVGGVPSTASFDTNVSLPGTTTTAAAATGSTTSANDFVYAIYGTSSNAVTQGAGWNLIQNSSNFIIAEYQGPVAAGSFTGNISSNSNISVGVLDALVCH